MCSVFKINWTECLVFFSISFVSAISGQYSSPSLLVYTNLINMVLLSLCTIVVYFNGIVSNILRLFTFSLFSYDSFANHCLSRVFYNKLYIKYSFITPSFQKLAFFLFSKMFVILAYLALLLCFLFPLFNS